MWKPFAIFILFVCNTLGVSTAGAVSFEPRDFDALAVEADQVVIGTAVATNSRRTGTREIVTDYRFNNLEIVKGTVLTTSLTLTMLGGTVGTDTLTVAGAPTFQKGVRYLVFIAGNNTVMFPLVGGQQGIFQIRKEASTGISRVHDYAGRAVTRLPRGKGHDLVDHLDVDVGEPLTENVFVDAIRAKVSKLNAK